MLYCNKLIVGRREYRALSADGREASSDEKSKTCGVIFAPASLKIRTLPRRCLLFYSEAVEWIGNIERGGSDYGLERERRLLDLLGSPDEKLKIVHVAGTNGKGSVTAYLTAVFVSACLKTGTYNSPSVFDYNERFLLNGTPVTGGLVAEGYSLIKEIIAKEQERCAVAGEREFKPTAFEIETAFSLWLFNKQKCDVVILETGLGGRWDATNAIKNKEVAVITPIGLDHCAILGDTLEDIAKEKAEIVKKDLITCPQPEEVSAVLKGKVKEVGGRLTVSAKPSFIACDLEGQIFEYKGETYTVSLLGEHQQTNASLAIETVFYLRDKGFKISDEDLKYGLASAEWHARFEIVFSQNNRFNLLIPNGKVLVLDGGHNPQGIGVLVKTLEEFFGGMRIQVVMGVLKDKDYVEMARLIAPIANRVVTVTPPSPRALPAEELASVFRTLGKDATAYDLVPLGVQQALGDFGGDVVVLCGSLTLFGALGKKNQTL